jgi:hypothetical protein
MDNLSCGIATSWLNVGDSLPHLPEIIQRYFTPVFVRTMLPLIPVALKKWTAWTG